VESEDVGFEEEKGALVQEIDLCRSEKQELVR
jgi:hypothetical protein